MKSGATIHLTGGPHLQPLSTPKAHLIRPPDTFSPAEAEKGNPMGEGYLDKVAVAKRLGVKPRTIGEWANQGKLPAYRIGIGLRFKWAEVEAHLAATCRVVAAPRANREQQPTEQPSPRSDEPRRTQT